MSSRVKKPQPVSQQPNKPASISWSGPLPPPEALARFDQIIPNGAARILRMTEQEQLHRIEIERTAQAASIQNEKLALEANIANSRSAMTHTKYGLIAGATVSILSIGATVYSIMLGADPKVSIALVSVPVLGMVKALIGSVQGKTKD